MHLTWIQEDAQRLLTSVFAKAGDQASAGKGA
jgi:hypothetical protein